MSLQTASVMITAFMLAAVLLSVASLCLCEDHHYCVSPTNGPPNCDCHCLNYYLSHPELFFTSNTRITFLEGTHLLDREEPIKISNVNNLTFNSNGQWVRGPEETNVMKSTAVIYCTNGNGGFEFYGSSQISIINLSLINCGALHTDAQIKSTLLFLKISELIFRFVSIQNSSEHGLVAHNCDHIEMFSCSIAYSNIDRKSSQCNNSLVHGSNLLIIYHGSGSKNQLKILNSNFSNACGKFRYGSVAVHAVNTDMVTTLTLKELKIVQKVQNGASGLVIWSQKSHIEFNFSDSIVLSKVIYNKGVFFTILSSIVSLNLERIAFYNNSEGQLHLQSYNGTIMRLCMNSINFLHEYVAAQKIFQHTNVGVYIFMRETRMGTIVFNNLTMSLNNAFHTGFRLQNTLILPVAENFTIINSTFSANQNMKSVLHLAVDRTVNIINCHFFNNSGISVISVSTYSKVFFTNVKFDNNIMNALTVWNGVIQFKGKNVIRNSRRTGVYLQGESRISVKGNSELAFFNNTAKTVGGAIRIYDIQTSHNDYCSILVSNDSQIIFSGNRAVEGGGDVYGARLVDCLDIDDNHVPRQGQPNETSWYFNIPQSHRMNYSNTEALSSFSSDPIMVCFCENTFPNCSKRMHFHEALFPGEEAKTEIATVGNYGGTSSGTVSIAVH